MEIRSEEALIVKMSEKMIAGKLEELMLAKMTEKMRAGNSEEVLVARVNELDQQIANIQEGDAVGGGGADGL